MGNRAVITEKGSKIGVYLHWNGGRDSVEAFLEYCKIKGIRSGDYGIARFAQIVGNFIGGTLSIGIDILDRLDCNNGDNGMYIIENWEIVGRKYFKGVEQNVYDRREMLLSIDEAQPEQDRIGEWLTAEEVDEKDLKIGDQVIFLDYNNTAEKAWIVGYGNGIVNGSDVTGRPYIDKYGDDPSKNPNNYASKYCTFRRLKKQPEQPKQPEQKTSAEVEMFINEELKGIEIKFAHTPTKEVREQLKAAGFKWHFKKALWYAKSTKERIKVANAIISTVAAV